MNPSIQCLLGSEAIDEDQSIDLSRTIARLPGNRTGLLQLLLAKKITESNSFIVFDMGDDPTEYNGVEDSTN